MGIALNKLGEIARALECHRQHLGIAREIGDRRGQANAFNNLGLSEVAAGRSKTASALFEEAVEIYRSLDDRVGEANAMTSLVAIQRETSRRRARRRHKDLGDKPDGKELA